MTPAETVLAFQQAAELRDGSAFVDGSIVEHWACREDVGLLAQVGDRTPVPQDPGGPG